MQTPVLASPRILVQEIESGLHRKVWRLGRADDAPQRALVYLSDGGAQIAIDHNNSTVLKAPALFWLGHSSGQRLAVEAGTSGYVAEFAEQTVTRAAGDFSDTGQLIAIAERDHHLPLERKSSLAIAASLSAIRDELHTPQSGSQMLMVAHLRVILVAIMRLAGAEEPFQGSAGTASHFLQQFRQLLEGNFRSHWPVSLYAERLGISYDRLHAICRRELGKGPKALVAERLAREAGLGLERSTMSIEQLSHALGFRDPAHFSHFFKRMTGVTPGAFRRMTAHQTPGTISASPANFADWP